MARTTLTTESGIQHDGGMETFLTRQAESLRHWAEPRIEAALAWGEHGAALGGVGATVAAEEGRRRAKDAKDEYVPAVKKGADRAGKAVAERYGKVAPAVTAGVAAVAPVVERRVDAVQGLVSTLQDQAKEAGREFQKEAAAARKDAQKQAKKKARKVRRGGARKAERTKDAAAKGGLTAAGLLAAAASAVQDQGSRLAPQVQERLAEATRYAEQRREDLAPVAASRLADVAGTARRTAHDVQVPPAVEQALIALTGDRRIVAKLRKGAEGYAGQTEKSLKRTAGKSSRSGGRGWIVAGMVAAAGGAGYAVWKLTKPVQDPWAAPVPGPITANIPVVQRTSTVEDSYAKQRQAVAEVKGARAGQSPAIADANAQVLGGTPRQGVDPMVRPQDAGVEPVIRTQGTDRA